MNLNSESTNPNNIPKNIIDKSNVFLKKAQEKRAHRRHRVQNLWITEASQFIRRTHQVLNISEEGVFLLGRVMLPHAHNTTLIIQLPTGERLEIASRAIYDHFKVTSFGTGFQFLGMSEEGREKIRNLVRFLSEPRRLIPGE